MSENKINLVVPKEYNGTPIEVVLREGKASVALDPKEPERVVINGTIEAPFRWLEKRVELINQKSANIIVNRDKMCLALTIDETNYYQTVISGVLQASKEMQDVGTESNTEKEKGQASDAFKRAGFNWGIGRELYSAPFIWVKLESNEIFKSTSGKCSTYTKFSVSEIEYDENREVSKCIIVDNNGVIRYQFPIPKEKKSEKTQQNSSVFSGKQLKEAIDEVRVCKSRAEVNAVWKKYAAMQNNLEFKNEIQTMCKRFPK
jgi:hypothetical protein